MNFFFRIVNSTHKGSLGGNEPITMTMRCGTQEGVSMSVFQHDTHRDLAMWVRVLVQGAHSAVQRQKEVACCKLSAKQEFLELST